MNNDTINYKHIYSKNIVDHPLYLKNNILLN